MNPRERDGAAGRSKKLACAGPLICHLWLRSTASTTSAGSRFHIIWHDRLPVGSRLSLRMAAISLTRLQQSGIDYETVSSGGISRHVRAKTSGRAHLILKMQHQDRRGSPPKALRISAARATLRRHGRLRGRKIVEDDFVANLLGPMPLFFQMAEGRLACHPVCPGIEMLPAHPAISACERRGSELPAACHPRTMRRRGSSSSGGAKAARRARAVRGPRDRRTGP